MKHPLDRLMRLRSLLEDVSRVELEAQLQELAQIERALTRSHETGRALRERSFSGIKRAQSLDWLEAEAISVWVVWERGAFEKARQRKTVEVNAAKAVYLDRRKECRQVGSVIEASAAAGALEQSRREQRELDDWFGQLSRSRRGREE